MDKFHALHERYERLLQANELATPPLTADRGGDLDRDIYERMVDDLADVAALWRAFGQWIVDVRRLMNESWADALVTTIPLLSQPSTLLYGEKSAPTKRCEHHGSNVTRCCFLVTAAPSHILGAGHGLFAKEGFGAGDLACRYVGDFHTVSLFLTEVDDKSYGILLPLKASSKPDDGGGWRAALPRPSVDLIVDPSNLDRYRDFPARYINDPREPTHWNCAFVPDAKDLCAKVVVTKEIKAGEELFLDYGEVYWAA